LNFFPDRTLAIDVDVRFPSEGAEAIPNPELKGFHLFVVNLYGQLFGYGFEGLKDFFFLVFLVAGLFFSSMGGRPAAAMSNPNGIFSISRSLWRRRFWPGSFRIFYGGISLCGAKGGLLFSMIPRVACFEMVFHGVLL